jgi:hypothetical protein
VVAHRRGKVVLDVERETLNATTEGILAAVTPNEGGDRGPHRRPMAIEGLVGELDAYPRRRGQCARSRAGSAAARPDGGSVARAA